MPTMRLATTCAVLALLQRRAERAGAHARPQVQVELRHARLAARLRRLPTGGYLAPSPPRVVRDRRSNADTFEKPGRCGRVVQRGRGAESPLSVAARPSSRSAPRRARASCSSLRTHCAHRHVLGGVVAARPRSASSWSRWLRTTPRGDGRFRGRRCAARCREHQGRCSHCRAARRGRTARRGELLRRLSLASSAKSSTRRRRCRERDFFQSNRVLSADSETAPLIADSRPARRPRTRWTPRRTTLPGRRAAKKAA